MSKAKDYFGREVKPGDYFCFATRFGNCGNMNAGIVREVKGDGRVVARMLSPWVDGVNKRNSTLGAIDRMVIVPPEVFPDDVRQELEAAK